MNDQTPFQPFALPEAAPREQPFLSTLPPMTEPAVGRQRRKRRTRAEMEAAGLTRPKIKKPRRGPGRKAVRADKHAPEGQQVPATKPLMVSLQTMTTLATTLQPGEIALLAQFVHALSGCLPDSRKRLIGAIGAVFP